MTATEPTSRARDGNATDLRYLEEAGAALAPIMAVCGAAATRSASSDVRALASDALSVQGRQLSQISTVLHAWQRPAPAPSPVPDADALDGLRGEALDRVFVERLHAHARASIAGARGEMVGGASPSARRVAEDAIHAGDRQVAALLLVAAEEHVGTPT
jgi:uncharacterized protein (DUF305 family)